MIKSKIQIVNTTFERGNSNQEKIFTFCLPCFFNYKVRFFVWTEIIEQLFPFLTEVIIVTFK